MHLLLINMDIANISDNHIVDLNPWLLTFGDILGDMMVEFEDGSQEWVDFELLQQFIDEQMRSGQPDLEAIRKACVLLDTKYSGRFLGLLQ